MESCILWLCNKKFIWLWNWIWNQRLPFFIDNKIYKGFIFWKQSSIKGVLMSFNHVSNNYWQTSTIIHQLLEEWSLLSFRANRLLSIEECSIFDTSINLFPTHNLANSHNKYMLQALAMPIARSILDFTNDPIAKEDDSHQL